MDDSQSYYETLARWQTLKETISKLQGEERALREGLFDGAFENPKEGTNTMEMPDGRKLKGVYKINRIVDEEALEGLHLTPTQMKSMFRAKHSLRITAYKELDTKGRKVIDAVLVSKPGLPTLSVIEAKPSAAEVKP